MKTYRLTTDIERIAGIAFSVIMTACLILLLYVLRNDITILIMIAVGALLLIAALVYYVISAAKAACIPDPEHKMLHVKGIRNYTLDLSNTATLDCSPAPGIAGHYQNYPAVHRCPSAQCGTPADRNPPG